MKVLLAIEQTHMSLGAIRLLKKLMLPSGSELCLLHVHAKPQQITALTKERNLKLTKHVQEIQQDKLDHARQFLNKIRHTLRHQDVRFQSLVKKGFPGEEILKTIRTKGIDLAILGTRNHSKVTRFFLGSVSQWVLQAAPCSVLIARNRPRKLLNDRHIKLLLATDGSPDSQAAVAFVNALALPPSAKITIVHVIPKQVWETDKPMRITTSNQREFAKLAHQFFKARGREGTRLLRETRKALSVSACHISEQLSYGNAVSEISNAARYGKADLVVVGSRGLSGLKRMFLGSVSNKIVHCANCSVAVIRHQTR